MVLMDYRWALSDITNFASLAVACQFERGGAVFRYLGNLIALSILIAFYVIG